MKYKVQIAAKAKKDFDSIIDYLCLFGKQPAKNFIKSFNKQLDIIADGTIDYQLSRFQKLADLGYHSVLFNNYFLLYYEEDNKRIISHIFHQTQNYTNLVIADKEKITAFFSLKAV